MKKFLIKAVEGPFLSPGRLEKGEEGLESGQKVELETAEVAGALA